MDWLEHTPMKLGLKPFFDSYLSLAKERFDIYFPGQWELTKRLECLGANIIEGRQTDDVSLLLFLIETVVWKEPYESESKKMIALATSNTYQEIRSAVNKAIECLKIGDDIGAIEAIGSLRGFGSMNGSRKIASVVLRFLDPQKFAVVDFRNWCILSNSEGNYFEKPLLRPLAATIDKSRRIAIDTEKYLQYLRVVRELASNYDLGAADIDVAIFAYSHEIRPLTREKKQSILDSAPDFLVQATSARGADTKRSIMIEILMKVVNDNKKAQQPWLRQSARKLEYALNRCNSAKEIMIMYENMSQKASFMDKRIAALGRLSLSHVRHELEKAYHDA